jgi:hypothetical protein
MRRGTQAGFGRCGALGLGHRRIEIAAVTKVLSGLTDSRDDRF